MAGVEHRAVPTTRQPATVMASVWWGDRLLVLNGIQCAWSGNSTELGCPYIIHTGPDSSTSAPAEHTLADRLAVQFLYVTGATPPPLATGLSPNHALGWGWNIGGVPVAVRSIDSTR
jgi:hypothetical protein